jgi:alpha-glucuronidase
MIEINIKNFLDIERRSLNYHTIHFRSRYDPIVHTDDFISQYGIFKDVCYSFKVYSDHVVLPEFSDNYFKSVETITLEDCLTQNYESLEIMIDSENIHKVVNGRHRFLRILSLCLDNKIPLDNVKVKCLILG